mmetsp:Transcript_29325/g.70721  ORF Transcript_29325/g.70721 Transcript_29325/m.70721 type:complete len:1201 (-) Transcript_29325:227-3829(-)
MISMLLGWRHHHQQQQQQQQPNFETIDSQGKKQSSPFTNDDTSSKDVFQQPSKGDQSLKKPSGQKQKEPVVEILDDDSDEEDNDENKANVNSNSNGFSATAGIKRSREEENDVASSSNSNKAARHDDGANRQLSSENVASAREASLAGGTNGAAASIAVGTGGLKVGQPGQLTRYPWHKPTWQALIPSTRDMARVRQQQIDLEYERNSEKSYELSLLNMNEFTISGLPTGFLSRPCKVQGLRKTIKECSKGHGKAIFEVDKEGTSDDNPDGGKWRIPLGAYEQFLYALRARPKTTVQPIPNYQLSVASLGKARLDKGFPSTKKIIDAGVPPGLACSLADFQRGGVDFVIDKLGRALIADDMGLGKTVQGIASMAAFHEDWPLLVLTPSSARYHWEAEFMQWLGEDSVINDPHKIQEKLQIIQNENDDDDDEVIVAPKSKTPFNLLRDYQINVLKSGRDTILYPETRVVICSYGLAPSLFENNLLFPGMFKSVIVDESHYLKSMKTKRTKSILPILQKSSRCVLLSGTPALAKPSELWPQLLALKGRNGGWFQDEEDFHRKYVTRSSPARRAELHCMLTGTLMIRRMKTDMLKNLPKKHREKALVNVTDSDDRREFHRCMELLRQGKGVMANIAQNHSAFAGMGAPVAINNNSPEFLELKADYDLRMEEKLNSIEEASQSIGQNDASYDKEQWKQEQRLNIKAELDNWFHQRLHEINQNAEIIAEGGEEEMSRKAVLNRMYGMTARAKVPLIVKMLRQWLADPTKGKLCIFAHHIYVLDELVKQAGLSNATGSTTQYIRIDGSTSPQERQNQIRRFQDPRNDKLRVAVLGITAAGIAVTLTASSTVWFAELFWTPALMIQAEDRVHRIGQTSTCKILYFVANGTLDLLLWSLLEKKFRALGEFVEGQEKMKIVVQKTYESAEILEKEYFVSGRTNSKDDDKDDEEENRKMAGVVDPENAQDVNDLVSFQGQLGREIDELEREEMDLLKAAEEDEGEFMDGRDGLDGFNRGSGKIGRSEHHAIDLDADGADSKVPVVTSSNAMAAIFDHRSPDAFAGCRYYMQAYENPQHRFGLELFPYDGRIMVGTNQHGLQPEPESGDILVGVNGVHVPFPCQLHTVTKFMSVEIAKGSVTLWLVDGGKEWKHRFEQIKAEETERRKRLQLAHQQFQRDRLLFQPQLNPSGSSGQSGNAVIELLDDSDDE